MEQDNRLYLLMARKLAGEATDKELLELQELLGDDFNEGYAGEVLSSYWKQEPDPFFPGEDHAEEIYDRIIRCAVSPAESREQPEPVYIHPDFYKPRQRRSWKKWIYAAAAIAAVGSALWVYTFPEKTAADKHGLTAARISEVTAKKGSRSTMILPDGSKVWLNADSRLTYQSSFNSDRREVELEGEAYFDVVKDPARPFIVHTSGIDVKVLGTSFNVKSYPSDATIEATLIRGAIEVIRKDDPSAASIVLHPHEKLVFNKEMKNSYPLPPAANALNREKAYTAERSIAVTALPENKADSLIAETSWRYNKLIFESDTFRQLADKMERWYNVRINIEDKKLLRYRFKGIFENETVQEALLALQLTNNFQFNINGNEIEIYGN